MNQKKKFYVVFAASGTMVADSYDRAVYCRDKYFRPPYYVKGFPAFEDANEAATDHLSDIAALDREIPAVLELNRVYASRKLPYLP